MELKDCFRKDFLRWLAGSNNPKIRSLFPYYRPSNEISDRSSEVNKIVEESLNEILDVLLREPLADYFWYGYPQYGGVLTYSVPSDGVYPVPGDALRVDREKIKTFLRDIKLEKLLK